jgi:hypothetical protein
MPDSDHAMLRAEAEGQTGGQCGMADIVTAICPCWLSGRTRSCRLCE